MDLQEKENRKVNERGRVHIMRRRKEKEKDRVILSQSPLSSASLSCSERKRATRESNERNLSTASNANSRQTNREG